MTALQCPEIDVGFLLAEVCTALLHASMLYFVLLAINPSGGVEWTETQWPAAMVPLMCCTKSVNGRHAAEWEEAGSWGSAHTKEALPWE